MDINRISIGDNPPWDINVIIEIPMGGAPVKYELDKESGALFVNRFLHTAMTYPANYGFVPHTLSEDGDPIDVLVVGQVPVAVASIIRSRPIGVIIMEDEAGIDEKILAVPVDALHPYYQDFTSWRQLPNVYCDQITHFFSHYKDLEKDKWVEVKRWGEAEEATELILQSIERAKEKPHKKG